MFSLFSFHPFFQEGQLTPFAPTCGRPWYVRNVGPTYYHYDTDTLVDGYFGSLVQMIVHSCLTSIACKVVRATYCLL